MDRPVTFDPVDAPLWEDYKNYQSLDDIKRAPYYRQYTIWCDPKNLEQNEPPAWVFKLNWGKYRYSEIDTLEKLRNIVTKNLPGIYIFSISPSCDKLLLGIFPSYALYVGISNVNESKRPLEKRLADYLPTRISQIKKRARVHLMLSLYLPIIQVYFAYVNKPSQILREIEEKLHGYLATPVSTEAYPISMKKTESAW